jgi:hypothetical protein
MGFRIPLMMQTLFDRIPNGWDSIANIFKQAEDALKYDAGRRDKSLLLQGIT